MQSWNIKAAHWLTTLKEGKQRIVGGGMEMGGGAEETWKGLRDRIDQERHGMIH